MESDFQTRRTDEYHYLMGCEIRRIITGEKTVDEIIDESPNVVRLKER